MYKYLGLKDEIQVPNVHYPHVRGYHIFNGKGVSSWQVDYELLSFHCRSLRFSGVLELSGLLNGAFVDGFVGQFSETPEYALRRFVS